MELNVTRSDCHPAVSVLGLLFIFWSPFLLQELEHRYRQFMLSTEPYLVPNFGRELKKTGGLIISPGLRKRESTSVRVDHAEPSLQEGRKGILTGLYVKPVVHFIQYFGKPAFSVFLASFDRDPLLVKRAIRNIYYEGPDAFGTLQDRSSHGYPRTGCYVKYNRWSARLYSIPIVG